MHMNKNILRMSHKPYYISLSNIIKEGVKQCFITNNELYES